MASNVRRASLDELKAIPIKTALSQVLGISVAKEEKDSWQGNPAIKYKIADGHHLSVCGNRWYDYFHHLGGNGSISLVQHLRGYFDWKKAADDLQMFATGLRPDDWKAVQVEGKAKAEVKMVEGKPYTRPDDDKEATRRGIGYLTKGRAIPYSVVMEGIKRGDIYCIVREIGEEKKIKKFNIRFAVRDLDSDKEVAALVREVGEGYWNRNGELVDAYKGAEGPKTNGAYFANNPKGIKSIRLCEGAIDALSLYALDGCPSEGVLYAAVGGEGVSDSLLKFAKDRGARLEICFDNDGGKGVNIAKRMGQSCLAIGVPFLFNFPKEGKDWNAILMARAGIERAIPPKPKWLIEKESGVVTTAEHNHGPEVGDM